MSADHRREDLLPDGLGPPLATVSKPGYEASLRLDPITQQLWLVEHGDDASGEDWTATPARDMVATSFAQGTLLVGGRVNLPVAQVEVRVGARVRRPRPASRGAWLTSFEDLALPFELVVRELDGAGSCVEELVLNFPADPPVTLRGRLATAGTRFALGLRKRTRRRPKGTHSYP